MPAALTSLGGLLHRARAVVALMLSCRCQRAPAGRAWLLDLGVPAASKGLANSSMGQAPSSVWLWLLPLVLPRAPALAALQCMLRPMHHASSNTLDVPPCSMVTVAFVGRLGELEMSSVTLGIRCMGGAASPDPVLCWHASASGASAANVPPRLRALAAALLDDTVSIVVILEQVLPSLCA